MKVMLLSIIVLCCSFTVNAQNSLAQSNAQEYENIGLDFPIKFYNKYNVDLKQYNKFLERGVDLKDARSQDYRHLSLFTDAIVVGRVVNREYDMREDAYYHTILTFEVTEVVRGENVPSEIKIFKRSGSLGEDKYVDYSFEKTFFVGQEVLVYLHNIEYEDIHEALEIRSEKLKINTNQKLNQEFEVFKKYTIKNNMVFDGEYMGSKDGVISDLNKIMTINKVSF